MKVETLDIQNFRGIREGSVHFKDHPVLIGANNTGKTTVIEALTLLLGRERMITGSSPNMTFTVQIPSLPTE